MALSDKTVQFAARAALVAVAALGLGACSRSQHITDDIAGPGRHGAGTQVVAGCPTLTANTLNTADVFNTESGLVSKFKLGRLRIESIGDIAVPSILSMGACAAADIPTISVIGGHANVFLSGTTNSITTSGNRLTFGSLLFAGTNVEPGTVFASDAEGNVLQIIWPQLAGLGTGSPIVRVQLARWNAAVVDANTALDVTFDLTFQQDGTQQTIKGSVQGVSTNGTPVVSGGGAIAPCPATLGAGGAVVALSSGIKQFRSNRLRFEIIGDVANGAMGAAGACAAADAPTIHFTGGSANMTRAGTNTSVTSTGSALTFGSLLFPGALLEPGVVIAAGANGSVLQIIWPALAGLPPGPPVLRFQQAKWNAWILAGRSVDVSLRFDGTGPDGKPAVFTATANNIVIPQMR